VTETLPPLAADEFVLETPRAIPSSYVDADCAGSPSFRQLSYENSRGIRAEMWLTD